MENRTLIAGIGVLAAAVAASAQGGGEASDPRRANRTGQAIAAAFGWLQGSQQLDGSWLGESKTAAVNPRIITNSLIIHACVRDGSTMRSGQHKDTIKRAVRWLREQQSPAGEFGDPAAPDFVHAQAIATFAMNEIFHASAYKLLQKNARSGLAALSGFRHKDGGWKSRRDAPASEPSLAMWGVLANVAGENAGLQDREAWAASVTTCLRSVEGLVAGGSARLGPLGSPARQVPPSSIVAGAAAGSLWAELLVGRPKQEVLRRATELSRVAPRWSDDGTSDPFGWFCTSQLLAACGGEPWRKWSERLQATLIPAQRTEGALAGSWDPVGVWRSTGRTATTAVLLLALLESEHHRAQPPAPGRGRRMPRPEPEETFNIAIVCERLGEPRPRVPGDASRGDHLVDHLVTWSCGPKSVATLPKLRHELQVVASEPTRMVQGADGKLKPLPVVLRPGFGACYGDVVAIWDEILTAGFTDVRLSFSPRGAALAGVTQRRVADPDRFGPAFLPPGSRAGGASDTAPAWYPLLRVDQRGRVYHGDAMVHDPARPESDGRAQLYADLQKLARAKSLVRIDREGHTTISAPVLIWADRWTDWRHVGPLMAGCWLQGFRELHLAVAGDDPEARLIQEAAKRK